jgi:hypothetical protein
MINVWNKYGEPRLHDNRDTDLVIETWQKSNEVSKSW